MNSSYITEALDPRDMEHAIKDVSISNVTLKRCLNQAMYTICHKEYDDLDDINYTIKKCDRYLEDIEEERKIVKSHKKTDSSLQFSVYYCYKLLSEIIKDLILPLVGLASFELPGLLKVLCVGKDEDFKTRLAMAVTGATVAKDSIENVKLIKMSLTDYNKLLDYYEDQIKYSKKVLETLRDQQKKKGSAKMEGCILEELEVHPDDYITTTKYISADDIKSGKDDSSLHIDNDEDMEVLHDEDDDLDDIEPHCNMDECIPEKHEIPHADEIVHHGNPDNIEITKDCDADRYYINYNQLKNYMSLNGEKDYNKGVEKIMQGNNEPHFIPHHVTILMGQSDYQNCSESEIEQIENSEMNFEIHGTTEGAIEAIKGKIKNAGEIHKTKKKISELNKKINDEKANLEVNKTISTHRKLGTKREREAAQYHVSGNKKNLEALKYQLKRSEAKLEKLQTK